MEKQVEIFKSKLDELYSNLGVFNVPLETKCPNSKKYWTGIEHLMWNDNFEGDDGETNFSHLSIPWIGKEYDKLKLLVVGINMNGYGGYSAFKWLAVAAQSEILAGHKKIKFDNPNYGGTFFWHRIPSYVVGFLDSAKLLKPIWEADGFPSKEDIAKAFDYFAITNLIKCSPNSPKVKSKPAQQMFENCGKFILREEIRILKPEKVLICGISDNFNYFNNQYSGKN